MGGGHYSDHGSVSTSTDATAGGFGPPVPVSFAPVEKQVSARAPAAI
jgi:hypothetical protein